MQKTISFKCNFIKKLGSGRSAHFMVQSRPDMMNIICHGMSPAFRKGTPLCIIGSIRDESGEIIDVTEIVPDDDTDALVSFLTGKSFKGVAAGTARKVLDALRSALKNKGSVYELSDTEMFEAIPEKLRDDPGTERLLTTIISIRDRLKFYSYVKKNGGSYAAAEAFFLAYGSHAYNMFRNDPYSGIRYGIELAVCDRIYRSLDNSSGMVYCRKRIDGILNVTADRIRQTGACCVKVSDAVRYAREAQKGSAYPVLPDAFILCAIAASEKFHVTEVEGYGPAVYPVSLYYAEKEIASELFRLSLEARVNGTCTEEEMRGLDPDQQEALRMIETTGVRIITGGPGVGKTTVIDRVIRAYRRIMPKGAIKLAAPTGKAAVRMSETSGGECATTIHKLLGMRPFGEKDEIRPDYGEKHRLPRGLFVIDEASMIDELLLLDLLKAIPEGSTVIFSGDPMQLPSVDSGTILKDMIASGIFPVARLTTMHRQDKGSLIARNYKAVSKKQTDLSEGDSFVIIRDRREKLLEKTIGIYEAMQDAPSFQILSATRKGLLGSDNLNAVIAAGSHGGQYGIKYMPGDRVMMTRNNYASGYWNGDAGVISEMKPEGALVKFYDGTKLIMREDFADMEYAFACTVHKAQGSEYDEVAVILDNAYPGMLTNQIILTAITRAKKKVWILAPAGALEKAVTSDGGESRTTGLAQAIIKKWRYASACL